MSSDKDKNIEESAITILSQAIENQNGKSIDSMIKLITFIAIICSNAATLEHVDFKKLPLDEQVNIAIDIIPQVYSSLKFSGLIPKSFQKDADLLISNIPALKQQMNIAISLYDLTTQITGLPLFNDK